MRSSRVLAASIIVGASVGSVAYVRAAESGRSRDAFAHPGERVAVVAQFTGQTSGTVAVFIDGQIAGTGALDASGLVRATIAAPSAPGTHSLTFALGMLDARATLLVLDPAKPALLVDLDTVAARPDAKAALDALAGRADIIYLHEGDAAAPSLDGLPKGGYAKLKSGTLTTWLQGLASRNIKFVGGIAGTSAQALAMQAAGVPAQVATAASFAPGRAALGGGNAPAPLPAPAQTGIAGSWEILDATGRGAGRLDLQGAGPGYTASRNGAQLGTATATSGSLDVTYQTPGSAGFAGALDSVAGGPGAATLDHYSWDGVEDAFIGAHAGASESLRRATGGNSLDLVVDGGEFLPTVLATIQSAKRSIHIESYIWRDEPTGQAVVNALCERAQAGVQVRAVMDGVGSMKAGALRDRLTASGAKVVTYNPVSLSNAGAFLQTIGQVFTGLLGITDPRDPNASGIDHRDHRKVIVVDGATAMVGGIGFADDDVTEWHDLHSRLSGPAVARIQKHFEESWRAGGGGDLGEDAANVYPVIAPTGTLALDVLTTTPGVRSEIKRAYLAKIASAQREVLIENPYFTDDEVIALLEAKARQGVPVTVILPVDAMNDVSSVASIHARIRPDLWACGVQLYDYPRMSHGKVAVVDGTWSTIGSCNLDNRSLVRNLELNVSSNDSRLADAMKARVFGPDLQTAQRWTPASGSQTFFQKAMGFFANVFRDWL